MFAGRGIIAAAGVAGAGIALALSPAFATATQLVSKKHASHAPSYTASDAFGSFTPAASDPRVAATLSRSAISGDEFRFTPSAQPGSRRAVTVAVRANATTTAEAQRTVSIASSSDAAPTSVTPSAYNLGVAVGWQRFALAGEVSHVDTGALPGGRESTDVALSYGGSKWSTKLQLAADRAAANEGPRLIGPDRSVSLDLGGSYSLTRNIDVTGGVRYRIDRDRLVAPLTDDRRDSQAVYVGTAFRF